MVRVEGIGRLSSTFSRTSIAVMYARLLEVLLL